MAAEMYNICPEPSYFCTCTCSNETNSLQALRNHGCLLLKVNGWNLRHCFLGHHVTNSFRHEETDFSLLGQSTVKSVFRKAVMNAVCSTQPVAQIKFLGAYFTFSYG